MKRILHRRPAPATLISCVALFASLCGVSWGFATGFVDSREILNDTVRSKDLRDNEIRTADLRNNEIRGRDIRDSTITGRDVGLNAIDGKDVLEASLGPVPRADTLDGVDSAGFVRTDGAGPAPIPLGPAATAVPTEPAPQFDVDPLRYVHLEGAVVAAAGQLIATLPAGARPAADKRFVVYSGGGAPAPAFVMVEPDGEIRRVGAGGGSELSLDGITFRAAG